MELLRKRSLPVGTRFSRSLVSHVVAVKILQELKKQLEEEVKKQEPEDDFDKDTFDDVLLRKMFVIPSYEIYGGVAGLYDFGPITCSLKSNFINMWKQHFIMEEDMLEVECTNLTPYCALKTSGR